MGRTAGLFSIPEYRVRLSVENALTQRIGFLWGYIWLLLWRGGFCGCVLVGDADALAMQEGIELDLFS